MYVIEPRHNLVCQFPGIKNAPSRIKATWWIEGIGVHGQADMILIACPEMKLHASHLPLSQCACLVRANEGASPDSIYGGQLDCRCIQILQCCTAHDKKKGACWLQT